MVYTIQGVVARAGVFPTPSLAHLKTAHLEQGIEMVPLATSAQRYYGFPFCPLTYDGAAELPQALAEICCRLSRLGTVAYIEAEVFRGAGTQAHVIFNRGAAQVLQ
jgi:hypothetical protein